MALKYQPKEATVLMCDFSGFQVPEMIKVRPVVVLRKHSQNHVVLPSYLPGSALTCWAKCDMIYTVATSRLDRCRVKSRQGSGREYMTFTMRPEHFAAVRAAVGFTLGFTHPATERSVVNVTLDA
jgi:mRNA-degrading endonuclease toxin of MazEF toxin-antitoxin module